VVSGAGARFHRGATAAPSSFSDLKAVIAELRALVANTRAKTAGGIIDMPNPLGRVN
jgi:hypothetical protein